MASASCLPFHPPLIPLASETPSPVAADAATTETAFHEAPPREVAYYGAAQVPGELMGGMFNVMIHPILNMTLGVNPAIIGILLLIRGLWDAFTDPLMAYFSDNFKSRWGRRRPFILVGGLAMILFGALAWYIPRGLGEMQIAWYFGIVMILFATAQTVYSVPYFAFGIELSPTYNGRTRVAAVRTFFSRLAALSAPWLFPFCTLAIFSDAAEGARWLVVLLALVSLPAILLGSLKTKERMTVSPTPRESFLAALKGMVSNVHFLRVTTIYALLLFVFGVFGAMQSYIGIYYVVGGDLQYGALLGGIGGTIGSVLGILCIPLMDWLSRRIQKHHALNVAVITMLLGTFTTWWLFTPVYPWLSVFVGVIYSLGVAAIFTVLPSLHADVIDFDEYQTGQRREGMLGAAAAFLMKTSQAVGAGISGFLITWTGFDVALGGEQSEQTFTLMRLIYAVGASIPLIPVILILFKYPLTEAKVHEVQAKLAERKAAQA